MLLPVAFLQQNGTASVQLYLFVYANNYWHALLVRRMAAVTVHNWPRRLLHDFRADTVCQLQEAQRLTDFSTSHQKQALSPVQPEGTSL